MKQINESFFEISKESEKMRTWFSEQNNIETKKIDDKQEIYNTLFGILVLFSIVAFLLGIFLSFYFFFACTLFSIFGLWFVLKVKNLEESKEEKFREKIFKYDKAIVLTTAIDVYLKRVKRYEIRYQAKERGLIEEDASADEYYSNLLKIQTKLLEVVKEFNKSLEIEVFKKEHKDYIIDAEGLDSEHRVLDEAIGSGVHISFEDPLAVLNLSDQSDFDNVLEEVGILKYSFEELEELEKLKDINDERNGTEKGVSYENEVVNVKQKHN